MDSEALKDVQEVQRWNNDVAEKGESVTGSPLTKDNVVMKECCVVCGFSAGVVLDPFAGVGTTCKVAKKYGRNYMGFEIKKEYCEIAEKYIDGADNQDFRRMKKNKPLGAFLE